MEDMGEEVMVIMVEEGDMDTMEEEVMDIMVVEVMAIMVVEDMDIMVVTVVIDLVNLGQHTACCLGYENIFLLCYYFIFVDFDFIIWIKFIDMR